jgi:hypothetical protein
MVYDGFYARCISMYMILNGTKHMYTITASLHRMIYVVLHVIRIHMSMSLNGIEHMYNITAKLHMMIYKASCLDVVVCLCFLKVWKACIRV